MKRSPDLDDALPDEPWLRGFVKPGDETLDAARKRFGAAQRECLRRMAAEGVELHRRFIKPDGTLTTANDHGTVRR